MIQSLRYLVLYPTDDGESPRPKHQASLYSHINYRYVATGADPPYSHFIHLELRNRIYEYALVPNRPIDIWPIVLKEITAADDHSVILRDNLKGINANLLQASRQIHSEAIGIFYGSNAFRFSDDYASIALTLFFENIGSSCRYVTNILAHISFHDKYVDDVSSWGSAPRHFNPPSWMMNWQCSAGNSDDSNTTLPFGHLATQNSIRK